MPPRLLTVASAVVALSALAACQKPAPIVTVVNEGRSTYAEAAVWCFEGQTGDACATRSTSTPTLEVKAGTIGVDVDKELADSRWIVTVVDPANPGTPVVDSGVIADSHYFSVDLLQLRPTTRLLLRVRALADGPIVAGKEPAARGSWEFLLTARR